MNQLSIRREEARDHRTVEELHRRAFWNLSNPGCNEHFLAHCMREHADFVPQLDLVAELDGEIVGNVMYVQSKLVAENGEKVDILTFGPIGVEPTHQREGIGKAMLERSFELARELGFPAIVIFGNPDNYVARGFVSCLKRNVCVEGGVFPSAMLVKELTLDFFDGRRYVFEESPAYATDDTQLDAFDSTFPPMEKRWQPSQEEFFIHCRSVMRDGGN